MSNVSLTRLHTQTRLHTCSSSLISWSRGELGLLPSASSLGSSALSSLIWVGIVLVCLHAPPSCHEHPGASIVSPWGNFPVMWAVMEQACNDADIWGCQLMQQMRSSLTISKTGRPCSSPPLKA